MDSSTCSSTIVSTTSYSGTTKGNSSSSEDTVGNKTSSSTSGRVIHVEDIQDENLLREMWVEAADGESKRQIRSRMYKLREERLKDFYNREGILENILKDEHLEVVGEKTDEIVADNNDGTTTTSSRTTTNIATAGGGTGTITTTTTRTTSNSNDDDIKDLSKTRINLQKDRSLSRKQSQEQTKVQPSPQKLKSITATVVTNSTRKISDGAEHEKKFGNSDASSSQTEVTSTRHTQISKSNGNNRIVTGKQELHQTNSNKLNANNNKVSTTTFTASNGHSHVSRESSNSNNVNNSQGKNLATFGGLKTVTITRKFEAKSKTGSTNPPPPSTGLVDNKTGIFKKTATSRGGIESHEEANVLASSTSSSRKNASSSSTTVNTMKLVKGLHSPPPTKKQKAAMPLQCVEVVIEKSVPPTPRFMATTKSREIGIASTQQYSNIASHHLASNKLASTNINILHRQDFGGKSTPAKSTGKVKQSVLKTVSNGATPKPDGTKEKIIPPVVVSKVNGKTVPRSRETSPKVFKAVKKEKVEAEKIVKSSSATVTSKLKLVKVEDEEKQHHKVKKEGSVGIKKTEESIIRELDNLDNYLYQRSKSIEDAGIGEKQTPLIIIGHVDVEQKDGVSGNLNGESKQMMRQQKQQQKQQADTNTNSTKISISSTTSKGKRVSSGGGTHAKQIEHDDNVENRANKSKSSSTAATPLLVDVMVSGVEPKVTKTKAYMTTSPSTVTNENDDGDIHDQDNQTRSRSQETGYTGIRETITSNANRMKVRDDETKSNTTTAAPVDNNESEILVGKVGMKAGETLEEKKKVLVSSSSSSSNNNNHDTKSNSKIEDKTTFVSTNEGAYKRKYKSNSKQLNSQNEMSQVETQIIIPTTARKEDRTIVSKKESIASTRSGEIQQQRNASESTSSSSQKSWNNSKIQSQQEKYDANILSRPSVFDKKKLYESSQQGQTQPSQPNIQTVSIVTESSKEAAVVQKNSKRDDDVKLLRHKIVKKDSPKDYNGNEKDNPEDDDDDDNPLKPQTRFSDQRRNLESPGAVLKAKSLFENKAHEASMDKTSGGFNVAPGTSFKVNKKAAIFEARSRGERVSISSESSSHVVDEPGNTANGIVRVATEDQDVGANKSAPIKKTSITALKEGTISTLETKKTVRTTKSNATSAKTESKFESTLQRSNSSNDEAKTPSSTAAPSTTRRRSSADFLETIEDVNQLEDLLYQATDYDERSRIRARIRSIKRQAALGKNTNDVKEKGNVLSKKMVNGGTSNTNNKFVTHNVDLSTTTTSKKSYTGRKSSEEILKTPRRKSSSEMTEQENNVARKSSSRKSSGGEVTSAVSTKENCTSTKSVNAPRKVSADKSIHATEKENEVNGNRVRELSGEINKEARTTALSAKQLDDCFERLSSSASVKSKVNENVSSVSVEVSSSKKVKSFKRKESSSPVLPLSRQQSTNKDDNIVVEDSASPKSEKSPKKQRKSSGPEIPSLTSPSSSIPSSPTTKRTFAQPSVKEKARVSRDEDLYSTRKSPGKDEATQQQQQVDVNLEKRTERKRFSSTKSTDSCGGNEINIEIEKHKVKSPTDEPKTTFEKTEKLKSFERKSSTETNKINRKASNELGDVEILTTEQLNDIKKRSKEATAKESPKRKVSGSKETFETSTQRTLSKRDSLESSKKERRISDEVTTDRKSLTGEDRQSVGRKQYSARKNSSKELKIEVTTSKPTKERSPERKRSAEEAKRDGISATITSKPAKTVSSDKKYTKTVGATGNFSTRIQQRVTTTKATTSTTPSTVDSVTSSYGVGPVDEDGTPLFGLRALRKIKQVQEEENQKPTTSSDDEVEQLSSSKKETALNIRSSDLYGLRALKKAPVGEDDNDANNKTIMSTAITTTSISTSQRQCNSSDSDNNDDAYKKLDPIFPDDNNKQPSPTPSATSPKSILKKTSSFSSNKSESKLDLNTDREREGTLLSPSFAFANDDGTGGLTSPSRLESPLMLSADRSRSNSSDDDWIRKSHEVTGSTSSNSTLSRGRVGRSSVKEMSKKFEKTELCVDDGPITTTSSQTSSNDDDDGKKITYTKLTRKEMKAPDGDMGNEFEDGIDGTTRMTKTTTTTRSFLTDHSPASTLTDVLERMRGENGASGGGGASEEESGRSLLNKFIGAQILMSGVEPLLMTSGGTSSVTSTSTMSSLVINGIDVDQEADSDKLRRLLDDCDGVEERGRIETRLKTLGSSTALSTVDQSGAMSSSKSVKASSKLLVTSASADVTGELMPLILGQLQTSLQYLSNNAGATASDNNDGDGTNAAGANVVLGPGTSKTQSSNSLIDGSSNSAASSLCNSNNNSTATLVRSGSTSAQAAAGEEAGSGSPDEDECLFDSGTESGEDAPPVSSTTSKLPSSSTFPLSSSTASPTPNLSANKLVSSRTVSSSRKKSEPSSSSSSAGEFTTFMEGLRHSLQQSASALVLSSLPSSTTKEQLLDSQRKGGKGISIGGGRTSTRHVQPPKFISAASSTDSDLIQQVDTVLSLLKDSLIKDPNYLEQKLSSAGPMIVDSRKGKELIALIDRLKSSLHKQETTDGHVSDGKKSVSDEPKPPDLLPFHPPPPLNDNKDSGSREGLPAASNQSSQYDVRRVSESNAQQEQASSSSSSSLLDEVPWKIRAAKKRSQGRSRSIGVSQEELEEARRFLQEEAFRTALKEERNEQQEKEAGNSGNKLKSIPGFRPMRWKGDLLNAVPVPFTLKSGADDKDGFKYEKFQATSSDDSSTLMWNKFGMFKPHKPFRTLSLDNKQTSNNEITPTVRVDDDPSSSLFTPQEVVQIEIHRAAIKKQMSDEEDRRRRRNSASFLPSSTSSASDDGRQTNKPCRDFSLTLPKPYSNPNNPNPSNNPGTSSGNGNNRPPPRHVQSGHSTACATPIPTTPDDEQQLVLYETASSTTRSTPTPQSPTKRGSIDNVQISLKDLTSNMFPQLQIAITLNTNGNGSNNGGGCEAVASSSQHIISSVTPSPTGSIARITTTGQLQGGNNGNSAGGSSSFKSQNSSSSSGGNSSCRYKNKNERKRRLKKANTIDIPQPYEFGNESEEEGDGEDEDDETMSDYNSSCAGGKKNNNPSGSNPNPNTNAPSAPTSSPSSNLGFIPKTESDKKFYAFLEKNNEQNTNSGPSLINRFNRPLSHLTVRDDARNSHFSNLKTSFESSTSQGSSPSISPIPSGGVSPSGKHCLINPEELLGGKQQQQHYSNKPIWAAKTDHLHAKSPLSVKNKLHVFESSDEVDKMLNVAARVAAANAPPQELWKCTSPEAQQQQPTTTMGYQPHVQTKPSSLLAKKESFEKFAEEHAQAQFQKKPVPAVRTKGKQMLSSKPAPPPPPPPLPPPPLPPKTGVHIIHATKSAMDAMARQGSNYSPVQLTDQPPTVPPRTPHPPFKSQPSSPTVEKPETPWSKIPATSEPSRYIVPSAAPQFTNPRVQISRELFETKQREAVLAPVPHPPPQTHVNVTLPLQQQQRSFGSRIDFTPTISTRSFEEEGVAVTGRSPYISVKKLELDKLHHFQNNKMTEHQSSSSPSPGQVEKISVVFQPIVHGKSLDSSSSNYNPSQSGHVNSQQHLHPKLAVFGVTRSIDDDRVVKGRLELESNKNQGRRDSEDNYGSSQGILNSAFTPSKSFVARKFESKNSEPLSHLRRQSIPVTSVSSTGGQASPNSPTPTLISPIASKVMKGPQQQRATVTRREMTSLGSDHPSAHRIRGDNNNANSGNISDTLSNQNTAPADTARLSIRTLLGQFQGDADKNISSNNFHHRQVGIGGPSLPLKKSHSGDALLQSHFLPHHSHGGGVKTSNFIPTAIVQPKEQAPVPQSDQTKFQPFQSHGFVQARSRFLEKQQPLTQSQPSLQKPQPAQQARAGWGPQGFNGGFSGPGAPPSTNNPFIPRQRSLSHFPPSTSQFAGGQKPQGPAPKPLTSSSFVSVSSPSISGSSPPQNNVHRIRFPVQDQQQQQFTDQIQRTSSGSSIFDRTKSLYISTQDAIGGGIKPKRRPPPSALPKSKTLFPKQYEAQMSPESADKKQREVEAFFKLAQKSETKESKPEKSPIPPHSHYRKLHHQQSHNGNESSTAYNTRIRKSASQGKLVHRQRSYSDGDDDVDQIFESLFNTSVESKLGKGGEEIMTVTASAVESKKKQQSEAQCQVQNKASASSVQSSGADGSSSTKTVKQQSTKSSSSFKSASSTSTASATVTSTASASPFSKFKQLDQQNSPTSGNKSGGPLFKFTNEALKTNAASAKDVLLYWCQCRVRDYQNVKLDNFSSSWSDGLAFCALIHHFYPDAFDYNKLDAKNRRHNFDLAFRVAEEKAGIYPLLDVEDMVVMGKKPDWKCVFTYVQSMYRRLKEFS